MHLIVSDSNNLLYNMSILIYCHPQSSHYTNYCIMLTLDLDNIYCTRFPRVRKMFHKELVLSTD